MSTPDTVDIVRTYYNQDAEVEWKRLENHPIEYALNMRYLRRCIQPGDRVLDMGGGPGRYALALAELGCDVTLADLSQANVDLALARAAERGLPLRGLCADARDPAALAGEQFDHVLLMGPLYHLAEERDRDAAVRACLALLCPGGTLAAAFISSFAGVVYSMKYDPAMILDPALTEHFALARRDLPFAGMAFTYAYFARHQDIRPFMARFPLEPLHLLGSESILSPNEATLLAQPPDVLAAWLDYAEAVAEREDLLSYAEHYLYIGRKRT